jgi:hypothetical protein
MKTLLWIVTYSLAAGRAGFAGLWAMQAGHRSVPGRPQAASAGPTASALWPGRSRLSARCVRGLGSASARKPFLILNFLSFSILYSVSTEFKLQKFISKYPELKIMKLVLLDS